mgnify:CR=1 FL=1
MKKIVFFILMLFATPINISANPVIEECGSGEIEIDYKSTKGATVVKRGNNPFLVHLEHENGSYYVNGVICDSDTYVIYGYSHFNNSDTFYDPLLIVLNDKGEQLHIIHDDYGELEEIVDVVWFDNVFAVVTEQHSFVEDPEFLNTYVTLYDNDFNMLEEFIFMEEFTEVLVKESLLVINYDSDSEYDIGIKSNGEEVSIEQIFDFDSNYYDEIYIPYINTAYINNEPHINGIRLSYPGVYDLDYNNQLYNFSLHPIITGVSDKELYTEPIFINVSGGNVLLNGELYVNDTEVNEPGNYRLEIIGNNNYSQVIEFTIKADIDGVINGHIYSEEMLITFTGTGYLNSNQVTSPLIIEKEGEYVFRVIGTEGYSEEYTFEVSKEDNFDLVNFIQKIDVYIVVGVLIAGIIIIKKSK